MRKFFYPENNEELIFMYDTKVNIIPTAVNSPYLKLFGLFLNNYYFLYDKYTDKFACNEFIDAKIRHYSDTSTNLGTGRGFFIEYSSV